MDPGDGLTRRSGICKAEVLAIRIRFELSILIGVAEGRK
jgi:hypothetical protein